MQVLGKPSTKYFASLLEAVIPIDFHVASLRSTAYHEKRRQPQLTWIYV
jgi:hypothetical protein